MEEGAGGTGGDGDVHIHLFRRDADGKLHMQMFAPRQRSLQDIPIYVYNLAHDGAEEFKAMVKARLARARSLAPVLIGEYQVPVLPLFNPESGMSHHIVRLIHSDNPNYMVDLLFRDCDYYFAGFRRAEVSSNGSEEWGYWFVYGDLIKEGTVPEFLQAIKMGLGSSHRSSKETKPGGTGPMEDIFFNLSQFQERVRIVTPGQQDYNLKEDEIQNEGEDEDEEGVGAGPQHRQTRMNAKVRADLVKAVARVIIVFSEAIRLRSLYLEILARLQGGWCTPASELESRLWTLIRNWGHMSKYIQEMLRVGTLGLHTLLSQNDFDRTKYGFETMTLRDLVGPHGEIVLAKRAQTKFINKEELQRLQKMPGAANVQDPGFPAETLEEEH